MLICLVWLILIALHGGRHLLSGRRLMVPIVSRPLRIRLQDVVDVSRLAIL